MSGDDVFATVFVVALLAFITCLVLFGGMR